MSLSDVYSDLDDSATPFPSCKTCRWYVALPPEDRAFFDDKVADPNLNQRKMLRACKAHSGLQVTSSSFRNHLREHHRVLLEFLS